jgi:TPR repeat protein
MTTTPLEQAKDAIAAARYQEAEALLKPLINTGDAEADYLYGTLLFSEPDLVDLDHAMEAFERAADLDHPDACYQLAITSIDDADGIIVGPVVDRDLLLHAAELGNIDAQRTAGALLANGEEGFEQDLAAARHWHQRAAEQGDSDSQYDVAWMMLEGDGGPYDPDAGLTWLEACAAQEHLASERAADFLASIFEEGRFDFEPDPEAAERWRARQQELAELHERQQKESIEAQEQLVLESRRDPSTEPGLG